MYATLENLKEFLEESVCKEVKFKRMETDEYGKPIYTKVHPDVYIFDGLISYNETKMPYIRLYATASYNANATILDVDLSIFVKNDGLYSYRYDEEGNQLADYNFEPNDAEVWLDAITLAQTILRALLNSEVERKFLINKETDIQIIPMKSEYVGDGIAQVDMKFEIMIPPYPIIPSTEEFLL